MNLRNLTEILIIDSGVGAVAVLNKLKDRFPTANYTCLQDKSYFPYSGLHEHQVLSRGKHILSKHYRYFDYIIIGCHTLSLAFERQSLRIPNVFYVSSTFSNLKQDEFILCTPLSYSLYKKPNLIQSNLAILIQNQEITKAKQAFTDHLRELPSDSNTLHLGCTHFSALYEEFQEIAKPFGVNVIDPLNQMADMVPIFDIGESKETFLDI